MCSVHKEMSSTSEDFQYIRGYQFMHRGNILSTTDWSDTVTDVEGFHDYTGELS